jgi:radical SAM superfamily enzyme YgiQ (UPF0313 family)
MSVVLITPYLESEENRNDFLPSGALLCLAAVLRENKYNPILLDLNNREVHSQKDSTTYAIHTILETIRNSEPIFVGISCLFSGFFETVSLYAKHIKEEFPHIKIIIGGIHPTTYPQEILSNCNEFDFIALGEAEKQIVQLAQKIENNTLDTLFEIESFAFRDKNGTIHINKERTWLDYADLPMQAWDLVDFTKFEMDLSNYSNFKNHEIKNVVPVISERGCPFKCTFCDMYIVQGRKVRRRTAQKFVDELEYLVEECGQRFFTFMDDNLTVNNQHILDICNEIIRRNLDIQFTTSGGLGVNHLPKEVIDAMVAAGMTSALLAPEHGSDYIRNDIIKKGLDRDTIYEVVENLKKHKVSLAGNWIMGFPEDTNETLQEMLDMINDLQLDRNWVGNIIPFPGTPIFDQCVRDNLFIEDININELWKTPVRAHQTGSVIKPYSMSLEELEKWRKTFIDIRFKYLRKL